MYVCTYKESVSSALNLQEDIELEFYRKALLQDACFGLWSLPVFLLRGMARDTCEQRRNWLHKTLNIQNSCLA